MLRFGVIAGILILAIVVKFIGDLPPLHIKTDITELPQGVQEWHKKGLMVEIFGNKMFVIDSAVGLTNHSDKNAVIFFHGFPCSSHDYHRSFEILHEKFGNKKRLIFFDHVGFGFSDKPLNDYEFTLHDHAENALKLFEQLDVKSAHIVAHDMGDSVLTEILSRRYLGLLPSRFDDFFKSVTFTNGGMRYDLINKRLTQTLLINPYIGPILAALNSRISEPIARKLSRQQLSSVYGPEANPDHRIEDIEAMFSLTRHNGGTGLVQKTCSYLLDRARFESRWYRALGHLDIPCMLLWGDSDAVAPMDIAKYLARNVIPPKVLTGKYLKNVGHFLMLEKPQEWSQIVSDFILNVASVANKVEQATT